MHHVSRDSDTFPLCCQGSETSSPPQENSTVTIFCGEASLHMQQKANGSLSENLCLPFSFVQW